MARYPSAADDPADFPDDDAEASVAKLIAQGTSTVRAVEELRSSIDRQSKIEQRRVILKWVLGLLVVLAVVDNRVQIDRLKRTLCPIVTASITRPGEQGPITQHGRDVELSARELSARLGCVVLPR